MKECKYCRTKYDDNLSACPSCGGTKVITAQEKAEDAVLYQKEIENRERAIAEPGIRKKRVFGIIAAIIAVVIVGVVAISYNTNKPLSNGMTKDEGETILAEGIAFYDEGDYESAIACFVQLPSDSKQYEEAQSMLEKCENEYSSSIVEKANGYAENGEYEMAINLLNNAGNILPNNAAISAAHNAIFAEYKEIICGDAYSEAEVYVSNGDYPSAIAVIDNAVELVGHDDELAAKREVCVDAYVSQVVSAAKAQYVEYNYESIIEAENIIEGALNVLPNNETLRTELEVYKEREPLKLFDLESFQQPNPRYRPFVLVDDVVSISGEVYKYAFSPRDFSTDSRDTWPAQANINWVLDFQYSKITGVLVYNEYYKNSDVTAKLSLTPSSGTLSEYTISSSDIVKDFEIDVTGSENLHMCVWQDLYNSSNVFVYLADVYVWK